MAPRYHYLDAARCILMVLGVILHAANIYTTSRTWIVSDTQRSPAFDALVCAIQLFRMPAFFIIAGFFALLSLRKASAGSFLRIRFRRLLLPLFATALVVNPVQFLIAPGAYPADSGITNGWERLLAEVNSGQWIEHLWFLSVLAVYCALTAALYGTGRRWIPETARRLARRVSYILQPLLIVLLPVSQVAVPALGAAVPSLVYWNFLGLVEGFQLWSYLPFFAAGLWFYADPRALRIFMQFRLWYLPLAAAAAFLMIRYGPASTDVFDKVLFHYGHAVLVWLACSLCFSFFERFFNRESARWRYMSDASYTIYLFHQVIVVACGMYLLPMFLPAGAKFAITVLVALAGSLAIHHFVILRSRGLRLAFNGITATKQHQPPYLARDERLRLGDVNIDLRAYAERG